MSFSAAALTAAAIAFSVAAFPQATSAPAKSGAPAKGGVVRRAPDGKPDMSGVWSGLTRGGPSGIKDGGVVQGDEVAAFEKLYGATKNEPIAMTPWAKEKWEYAQDSRPNFGAREELKPTYRCVPWSAPQVITLGANEASGGMEIIQSSRRVMMFYELDHNIRQIWTDGRAHSEDNGLTWMGDSIGKWEGDTLVVDTIGIRNDNWFDNGGHVFTPKLHIEERYQLLAPDYLQVDFTFTDPDAFTRPVKRRLIVKKRSWELAEDVRCYQGSPEQRNQDQLFSFDTTPEKKPLAGAAKK